MKNDEKVRSVIFELFEESGDLGRFRQQYSAAVIDAFLSEKSEALAKQIVIKIGEKFEEHAASFNQQSSGNEKKEVAPTEWLAEGQLQTDAGIVRLEVPVEEAGALEDRLSISDIEAAPLGDPPLSVNDQVIDAQSTALVLPSSDYAVPPQPPLNGGAPLKQVPTAVGSGDQVPLKFSFRLKGGKLQVGVPYDGRIESADGAPGAAAHVVSVELPAEIGLQSDASDPSHITGTPTLGGDVAISFSYRVEAPGSIDKTLTSSITVFSNHDPKSLWKDLLSDKTDPYWKPDEDSAFQQVGVHKIIAVSKRGRSHAHEGKFRDDDFLIKAAGESGWVVIAVADGAGSATKSRKGSQIAVSQAVDAVVELLAGEDGARLEAAVASWHRGEASKELVVSEGLYPVLGIAAFKACKAIEAESTVAGVAAKEFSTTLLVTVYKKTLVGHLFATYWVGDGGVGIYLNDGTPKLLGKVDSGEFAGQTRFLDRKVMTTQEIAARLHFEVVDDFKALVAMTDGITDPYFMTDNNLESGEYWGKLWSEIDPALSSEDPQAALLAWLDFWSAGNHDDRTIAILW